MTRILLTIAAACAVAGCPPHPRGRDPRERAPIAEAPELHVSLPENGHLLTVWEWRSLSNVTERALVLTEGPASRRVPVASPRRARWRGRDEILVEEAIGSDRRIIEMNRSGSVLRVLSERGLTGAEPSGDGRWWIATRTESAEAAAVEVRDLLDPFVVRKTLALGNDSAFGRVFSFAWSPFGDEVAAARWTREGRIVVPRLVVLSISRGSMRNLRDRTGGGVPGGIVPLFWLAEGIYARSSDGLLRCSAAGDGCIPIYDPGRHRFAFAGRPLGTNRALLLVQDHDAAGPSEVRAKEIHEVDLRSGAAEILVRLPPGVFISDLDWLAPIDGP
jgi:hypothetical protein